jgi:hypothetical protein
MNSKGGIMARTKGKVVIIVTKARTGEKTAYKSIPKAAIALKLDVPAIRYQIKTNGIFKTRSVKIEMIKYHDND